MAQTPVILARAGHVGRSRVAQLLQHPWGGWMRGHAGMQDAAGRVFHHHKDGEEAEGCRDHHAAVTRDDSLGMVADKGSPALGRHTVLTTVVQAFGHVLAHSPWRDAQTRREHQFVRNAFLAPRRVIPGHAADEEVCSGYM
jgi:hypothetical protein